MLYIKSQIAILILLHFASPSTTTSMGINTITPSPRYSYSITTESPEPVFKTFDLDNGGVVEIEDIGYEGPPKFSISSLTPWNNTLRLSPSSLLPGHQCRSLWIKHVEDHMIDLYSTFSSLSTVLQSWTQLPCETTSSLKEQVSTISAYTSNLEPACDGVIRQFVTYKTVTKTVQDIYTTCALKFFTNLKARNTTYTTTLERPAILVPLKEVPICTIPRESCTIHWKFFKDYFSNYKHFNWTTIWSYSQARVQHKPAAPISSEKEVLGPFQLENFLETFDYRQWDKLFGKCPEAKLDMLDYCIRNLPAEETEIFDDALNHYRRQVSDVSGFPKFQNASHRLEELESILGCDILIDQFSLQPFELPRWDGRQRDICANSGWGESPNSTMLVGGNITTVPRILSFSADPQNDFIYDQTLEEWNLNATPRSDISWTLTSPSVYLAYNTLGAIYPCWWRKGRWTEAGVITLHPDELSSIVPDNDQVEQGNWGYHTRSFDQADLEGIVPEKALSASQFLKLKADRMIRRRVKHKSAEAAMPLVTYNRAWNSLEIQTISSLMNLSHYTFTNTSDYNPMVAIPTKLRTELGSMFASCRPFSWHSNIISSSWVFRGVWDPPKAPAVTAGATLGGITLPQTTSESHNIASSRLAELSAVIGHGVPNLPRITDSPISPLGDTEQPQSHMKETPEDMPTSGSESSDRKDWIVALYSWMLSHRTPRINNPEINPQQVEVEDAIPHQFEDSTDPDQSYLPQSTIQSSGDTLSVGKTDPPRTTFDAGGNTLNILELHKWPSSLRPAGESSSSESLMDSISEKLQHMSYALSQYISSLPSEFLDLWNSVYYGMQNKNKGNAETITGNTSAYQPTLVSYKAPGMNSESTPNASSSGFPDFGKGVHLGTGSRAASSSSHVKSQKPKMSLLLMLPGIHILSLFASTVYWG